MSYSPTPNTSVSPFTTIVRITYRSSNGMSYQASGVMIAPDVVLTAAHVVNNIVVSSIVVTPDANNGQAPFGNVGAVAVASLPGSPQDGYLDQAQAQDDIGLIALSGSVGDETGWMGLDVLYAGGTVQTAGYPATGNGAQETASLATTLGTGTSTLVFNTGTVTAGSSGSPLWSTINGSPVVTGIVSTSVWAAQITPADTKFISTFEATYPSVTQPISIANQQQTGTLIATNGMPAISGTAQPGAVLTIALDGNTLGTVTADKSSGGWNDTVPSLGQGLHQVTATYASGSTQSPVSMLIDEMAAPVNGISPMAVSSVDLAALQAQGYAVSVAPGTETVDFLDGSLNIGTDTDAAFLARLYEGLLDRAPDQAGLAALDADLANGQSRDALASMMMNASEYQGAYPNGSNTQFVQQLYQNLLGRTPDQGGLQSWTSDLNAGASRADIATAIASTTEAQQDWTSLTTNLWVSNDQQALIYREYMAGLHRAPSLADVQSWASDLQNGFSESQLTAYIAGSPEFQALHQNQSDTAYVTDLYQQALGRTPDAAGLDYWVGTLQSGAASRADVLINLVQTPEVIAKLG